MNANEFHRHVIQSARCYAMTMPGTLVDISRSTALIWYAHALEQSTYKPTIQVYTTQNGIEVIVGLPVGQGTEVVP